MGLDMYAFAVKTVKQDPEDPGAILTGELDANEEWQSFNTEVAEVAYWRKFNALHNWMELLYRKKGGTDESFNCIKVPLSLEDLQELENVCNDKGLIPVSGFFFGSQDPVSDEEYDDVRSFINSARSFINNDLVVFYDSWW